MKTKFLIVSLFVALVATSGIFVSKNSKGIKLSDVALENVEALASCEVIIYCRPAYIWVCNHSIPLYGEPIQL